MVMYEWCGGRDDIFVFYDMLNFGDVEILGVGLVKFLVFIFKDGIFLFIWLK